MTQQLSGHFPSSVNRKTVTGQHFGIMGQVETKIFDEAPPWDAKTVMSRTDLSEEQVDLCWKMWCAHPKTSKVRILGLVRFPDFIISRYFFSLQGKLKEDGFYDLLDVTKDEGEEHTRAKKMFELLDRDDDQDLEFVDTMIFVFSLDQKITQVRTGQP